MIMFHVKHLCKGLLTRKTVCTRKLNFRTPYFLEYINLAMSKIAGQFKALCLHKF